MAYPLLTRKGGDTKGASPNDELDIVGKLADLKTADNGSLVKAINKLNESIEGVKKFDKLLVYYGYPIAYKGLWNVNQVITAISSKYKYWVVGNSYQQPTHEEYTSTTNIINGCRTNGVKVFGYVPIGQSTSGLTIEAIKTSIDQWVALNVDGIFLDEFGFDYGNTRSKQIEIVNYVHSKGLPYVANAWTCEDFCLDNVSELTWASNDWRYINFVTYNPTNLVLPRNSTDVYLIENFCISDTGPTSKWDAQERIINVNNLSVSKDFKVWGLAVLHETPTSSGNITNTTAKVGNLPSLGATVADGVGVYVSANAYLYDIEVVGIGGYSFGSAGTPVTDSFIDLPKTATPATQAAVSNFTTSTFTRIFGPITLTVTNASITTITVTTTDSSSLGIGEKAPVTSVNTKKPVSGNVDLTKSDIGLGNVDNVSVNTLVGLLANLKTEDKSSIVNAINELQGDGVDFLQEYLDERDS